MKKWFCLFAIFILVFVSGCTDDSMPQNEYGFIDSGDPDIAYKCAYKLNQTEFEKNNVTIDVYYGQFSGVGGGEKNDSMVIRLYLCATEISDPWYDSAHLIKEISGNEFYSDKYYCYGTKNEKGETRWAFNHHETIRIPEELFDRPKGHISIGFKEYFKNDQKYGSGKSINVNFSMVENTVVLSIPNS